MTGRIKILIVEDDTPPATILLRAGYEVTAASNGKKGMERANEISNAAKEIPNGNFYRLCDSQQRLDGNNFFAALNFTDIFRIQIHRFGELLLSQTRFFTIAANGIANDFSMPQNRLFLRVRHAQRLPIPACCLHQQYAGILRLRPFSTTDKIE